MKLSSDLHMSVVACGSTWKKKKKNNPSSQARAFNITQEAESGESCEFKASKFKVYAAS